MSDKAIKYNLLPLAKKMRHTSTDAEKKLWSYLRRNMLSYKIRRQHQIGKYIVDFVCLEKRLIIECDGGQHTEENDKVRSDFLIGEGYTILRFWNNDILTNITGVLTVIKRKLDEIS